MRTRRTLFAALLLASFTRTLLAAEMTAEELIAKHLEAIGTPQARAVKSRDVRGIAAVTVVVGGSGTVQGKGLLDSAGEKVHFQMDFNTPQYKGEQFIFDGHTAFAAMFQPGVRTPFGTFMQTESDIMREGLFGGVLTTGWALLDVGAHQPKLTYDGLKPINGKKLHQLSYKMRKGAGDLTIRLYFDPDTFRHVYSLYSLTRGAGIGLGGEMASSSQQPARAKLEEEFSDFVTFDGVTLPTTWKLTYTSERQSSLVHEYLLRANRIENEPKLAESAFHPTETLSK